MSGQRLFIGVRVSTQTANALAACAEMLQRRSRDAGVDMKWVAPTNYHVTLKFLGWTRDEALEFIRTMRPQVRPNPAFTPLLKQWEAELASRRAP